jgi:acyl-CoA thioester hydrolase
MKPQTAAWMPQPHPAVCSVDILRNMSVFQTRIRVRYAETDQMGVVYYANFFIWFEVARVELLRQLGFDYKQMEIADGCSIAVVEASCRYKSPARYDDELILETRLLNLRRSVLKFAYRVLRPENESDPRLLAEGETTHVVVDKHMNVVHLPEKYAAVLGSLAEKLPGPK